MIVFFTLIITYFIVSFFMKLLVKALREERPHKQRPYKEYDYWDDAGDGSGVNYVTTPDGEVRID